ncbi:hypothetical protein HDU79_006461 [Rhizoclosmatium sp. JEL0117]|nr:hypothetical protein HDU79_006461 [Rhizoclosmatium sp. JEL0117]
MAEQRNFGAESSLADLDMAGWQDQQAALSFNKSPQMTHNNQFSRILHQFTLALESPLTNYDNPEWELEDPDLMPTLEDWSIVYEYFIRKGSISSPLYDAESVLRNFFQMSAVLSFLMLIDIQSRLISCCSALKITTNNDAKCAQYYSRARKALIRSDLKPSLDLISAYNFIYDHGRATSQLLISEQFLRRSIEMIIEIRLNVDPDDSPWLSHLTAREKEERRRIFWFSYDLFAWQLAVSSHPIIMEISCNGMKPPRQVYDPNPVFDDAHCLKEGAGLNVIIGTIKNHYSVPPASIYQLISSLNTSQLEHHLNAVQNSFPHQYIIHFDDPKLITPADEVRLISQISATKFHLWFYALNMTYHIAKSAFFRPVMCLTALPSCFPMYLSSESQSIVAKAITECLECAWRMSSIWVFFDYMTSEDGRARIPPEEYDFYFINFQPLHVFELCIVFWFIACRMDPTWIRLMGLEDWGVEVAVSRMKAIVAGLRVYGAQASAGSPIIAAIDAMIAEMEDVVRTGNRPLPFSSNEMDALELGMAAASISSTPIERIDSTIHEPYCFMGLLGFEIGNKYRWKGRREDSWRLFWKLFA